MTSEQSQQRGVGQRVGAAIREGATLIVSPPRTALAVAVGSSVLAARTVRQAVGRAADEGEQQLERLNGSVRRAAANLWRGSGTVERPPPRQTTQE